MLITPQDVLANFLTILAKRAVPTDQWADYGKWLRYLFANPIVQNCLHEKTARQKKQSRHMCCLTMF